MFSQYEQEVKAWRDLEEVKAKGRKTRGRAVAEVEQTSTQVEESWKCVKILWKQNRAPKAEEEVQQLQRDRHQSLEIQIHQNPTKLPGAWKAGGTVTGASRTTRLSARS